MVEKTNDNKTNLQADIKENEVALPKKKEKKKSNVVIIVIIALIIIGAGVFAYFKFFKYSNKVLTVYRYDGDLFTKNRYLNDIDSTNLKKYTYKCKSSKCTLVGKYGWYGDGVSYRNDWIIINDKDSNSNDNVSSYVTKGTYILYNINTEKKVNISVNNEFSIIDVFMDSNNNPIQLLVSDSDSTYVVDIKTGNKLFDINDIIYGDTVIGYRSLYIVNNGYQDFYLFDSKHYSNKLLYDKDLKYVGDIMSTDCFDNDGNIIKWHQDEKTLKMYFEVYDLNGKLIRKSKMYDDVNIDNGYMIVQNNGIVSIIDSKEQNIVEISKLGKKYKYTTEYGEYYDKKGGVSIYEVQNPDSDTNKKVTQYFYNLETKKIEKYSLNFDGYDSPYAALSRFYNNGYETYKYNNVTLYLDKSLKDEKRNKFKEEMDELFKNKVAKPLFSSKQNVYMFTSRNSERIQKSGYTNYDSTSITYFSVYADGMFFDSERIVRFLAVNYFKDNTKKLENSAFNNLKDKYYSYYDNGFQTVSSYTKSYGNAGFFGIIMSAYYKNITNNTNSYSYDDDLSDTLGNISSDGKTEEFNKEIKKYVESYVIK